MKRQIADSVRTIESWEVRYEPTQIDHLGANRLGRGRTTFAAVPDILAMLKRRSTAGMNPRMAAIMCVFQILWVYYGLLIASRPVIVWNVIAVLINFLNVLAYRYFARRERALAGN